jgi:hypothetical protein
MVEDKSLAKALHALAVVGGVYDVHPEPVANAQAHNGSVKAKTPEGDATSLVWESIKKHQDPIAKSLIQEALTDNGFKTSSAGFVITRLIKSKRLKATKKRGVYEVLGS